MSLICRGHTLRYQIAFHGSQSHPERFRMSIRYDSKRETVAEIVRKATADATLVIPDLQRPYVWTPRQVTLLVDSLFRGWPFGSLLIWEVKPDCFAANEG